MAHPAFAGSRRVHEDLYKLIIGQLKIDGHEPIAQMLQHATGLMAFSSQRLETIVTPQLNKEKQKLHTVNHQTEEEKLDFDTDAKEYPKTPYRPIFFTSHKGPCYTATFSHDGKTAATGSADTSVKILEVDMIIAKKDSKDSANPCRHTIKEHKQPVTTLAFDHTDNTLATGSQDGTIKLYDLTKLGKARIRSSRTITDSHFVKSIDFHPSSKFLLVGTKNPIIRLYDINTSTCFASQNEIEYHSGEINHVTYSNDGKFFASCSTDGAIKLWDGVSCRCITTITDAHGGASIDCVRISQNMKYLLTSGRDNLIKLWDISMGQALVTYEGGQHLKYGIKASFSHNERYIFGGNDLSNTVVAWHTRTGQMVQQGLVQPSIPGHVMPIREIATSPNVGGFLTANEDKTSRFWYTPT